MCFQVFKIEVKYELKKFERSIEKNASSIIPNLFKATRLLCNFVPSFEEDDTISEDVVSFIKEETSNASIIVYPNPTVDKVNIKALHFGQKVGVEIYSMTGSRVLHGEYNNESTMSIDVRNLRSGRYMMSITDGVSQETKQFIKN